MRRLRAIGKHRASPILEVAMQTHADALPLAVARVGESRWRQAGARSVQVSLQNRRDVGEVDKHEIEPDDYPPYDHRGVVVVASAWLAFYIIAATHAFIASGY
jgi:hypothetical protein